MSLKSHPVAAIHLIAAASYLSRRPLDESAAFEAPTQHLNPAAALTQVDDVQIGVALWGVIMRLYA